MLEVHFPTTDFRIKTTSGGRLIFDPVRRKWVALTPEEWVRQHMVQWLLRVQQVPASLMAVEKMLLVGELKKRFDLVVFSRKMQPWLLVECKAMESALTGTVLQQALSYYSAMPAAFLLITNGQFTHGWRKTEAGLELIHALPLFGE